MRDQPPEWRGEGITEQLVAVVVITFVVDCVLTIAAFLALSQYSHEQDLRPLARAHLVAVTCCAGIAAACAAFVAYRAKWRRGGIGARAAACGSAGLVVGLALHVAWRSVIRGV
jgi:hypothetical protein